MEINDEVYSAKCDEVEKVKLFIDSCLELEEKMKLVKEELKHWQIKKGGELITSFFVALLRNLK